MSWVRGNLAGEEEDVRGIIFAEAASEPLKAVLGEVPSVELRTYRVRIDLQDG